MKLFFLILTACFFLQASAADPAFVVYHSKGPNAKSGSKTTLKKGDKLFAKDILVLGEGSKLVLICSNYQIIQLGKKGSFPVKTLLSQCKKAGSYSSSYFKYVWNELTHPHGKPEKDPEEYMKNVGAVSRGCNDVAFGLPADTINYYKGEFPLQWWASYEKPVAAVFEQQMDGAPIHQVALTAKQPLQLAQLAKTLSPGIYYWQIVGPEGGNCERKFLKIWDKKSYNNMVHGLLNQVPATSPAETAYANAYMLHENNFLAEALSYYKQAAKLNPKNLTYKTSLNKFYETNF